MSVKSKDSDLIKQLTKVVKNKYNPEGEYSSLEVEKIISKLALDSSEKLTRATIDKIVSGGTSTTRASKLRGISAFLKHIKQCNDNETLYHAAYQGLGGVKNNINKVKSRLDEKYMCYRVRGKYIVATECKICIEDSGEKKYPTLFIVKSKKKMKEL